MKADLAQREPEFLKKWEEQKIYEQLLEKNKSLIPFILHDGPPYANGTIHFGHILNKVLKDIIVKYKNMTGFYSPYRPGWDCHGLPIELGALKELEKNEKDKSKLYNPLVRRQACRDYALNYVEAQKEGFKRLGIMGEWENPYLTLSNQYEADIAREFAQLYENGFIYQGYKPVHWCISCRTALAEAEVEYENITSPSIYVKFKCIDPQKLDLDPNEASDQDIFFVIWTTTPWTLPANVALALGAQYEYVALQTPQGIYLVASDLKDSFLKVIGEVEEAKVLKKWTGQALFDLKLNCVHPFIKRQSKVILGHHVTLDSGTGVVHIAPGHGQEDYVLGQQYQLEALCPVDEAGRFIAGSFQEASFDEVKTWEGEKVVQANKTIVDFLAKNGFLLSSPSLTLNHSYPHCWRCKKPIIFRATEQWFLKMDHADLRKQTIRVINGGVQWIPSWGHERILSMMEGRPDWCLSRQRVWGVPIIVHYCSDCQKPHLDKKAADYILKIFEEKGADAWWESENALLPPKTTCSCGSTQFKKEKSILDVWFDSGVSHAAVLERDKKLKYPADLYLEGSDQHRGWFNSSLLTSMATRHAPPYKAVLTHGFVVDGEGKKYSKSAKNYLPPEDLINKMGVELLRLWVASEDYRNDIRFSNEIINVLTEIYRKMRNTCRFMLGNLYDFDFSKHKVENEKRTELDRYALHLLAEVVTKIQNAYQNYEFHVVHHTLNKFFTVDLSAIYLDILKDRLYCDRAGGALRRSAQSTLYDILMTVLPLMAPIFSFTAEDIWGYFPNKVEKKDSVFLISWPQIPSSWRNQNLVARWERIGIIRDEVLKALEGARQKKEIRHSLDAMVYLSATGETLTFLKEYQKEWTQIFIVSQVEIVEDLPHYHVASQTIPTLKIAIAKAKGEKCARCWNYSEAVGKSKEHPTLCGRCVEVVK